MISVILPTYNEAGNIAGVVTKVSDVLDEAGTRFEILVMDDNSPDGTAEMASSLSDRYPVRAHVRHGKRGLASAVLEGLRMAEGEICVVMDADLSHPPATIPMMVAPIEEGLCDMVIGSRYAPGGRCIAWPSWRRLSSRLAGLLAGGLTEVRDPTSGFMALRKGLLDHIFLDPVGWKIALEIMVRAQPRVREVPVTFSNRHKDRSKLSLETRIDYLHHLWRLYIYKYPSLKKLNFLIKHISSGW